MQLTGTTALLTGASGGLGQAIARALSERGVRLLLTGRRRDVLEALATETGGRAVVADLVQPGAAESLVADCDPVDLLVANAALPGGGPLDRVGAGDAARALDVNFRSPVLLAHALLPGMLERRRGHLVFVSSLQGLSATPAAPLYVATKFGLRGFALALRHDLAGTGVGASVVLPGFVRDAGMFADSGASLPPGVGTRSPEQVARATIRAVERNRPEVVVAPPALAAGAYLGGLAPGLSERVQRLLGARRLAAEVTAGQAGKR
ncbi:MAG TPA: SDR family NAD(P)-dependent oxidoreductase [Acidimicrobiales bacterium]|nr:SDR family NAD(P)-dependent oxidoreductase [Acidimicrobiales bacterium]